MDERVVRGQLAGSWRSQGFHVFTTDALRCTCGKPRGSGVPDLIVTHSTLPGFYVEVKVIHPHQTSLDFRRISDDQRTELTRVMSADVGAYLALGIIGKRKTRDHLEHLFVVPWYDWWEVELTLSPIQKSLPRDKGRSRFKEIEERSLDAPTLLAKWELARKNGVWCLPTDHPITRRL